MPHTFPRTCVCAQTHTQLARTPKETPRREGTGPRELKPVKVKRGLWKSTRRFNNVTMPCQQNPYQYNGLLGDPCCFLKSPQDEPHPCNSQGLPRTLPGQLFQGGLYDSSKIASGEQIHAIPMRVPRTLPGQNFQGENMMSQKSPQEKHIHAIPMGVPRTLPGQQLQGKTYDARGFNCAGKIGTTNNSDVLQIHPVLHSNRHPAFLLHVHLLDALHCNATIFSMPCVATRPRTKTTSAQLD
jgi:hypothetical protein